MASPEMRGKSSPYWNVNTESAINGNELRGGGGRPHHHDKESRSSHGRTNQFLHPIGG